MLYHCMTMLETEFNRCQLSSSFHPNVESHPSDSMPNRKSELYPSDIGIIFFYEVRTIFVEQDIVIS
jgi:hypothetical protein